MILNNEQESIAFAQDFAKGLKAGDIVLFTGDLGSGKTFLCREIIKYFCGSNIDVVSPTFNLLQTYETSSFIIYHYDLYRLKSQEEIYELGIDEALQNNLSLIEWPEIIANLLPKTSIKLNLQIIEDNKRSITILV